MSCIPISSEAQLRAGINVGGFTKLKDSCFAALRVKYRNYRNWNMLINTAMHNGDKFAALLHVFRSILFKCAIS